MLLSVYSITELGGLAGSLIGQTLIRFIAQSRGIAIQFKDGFKYFSLIEWGVGESTSEGS